MGSRWSGAFPAGEPPVALLRASFLASYVHAALRRGEDLRAEQLRPAVLADEFHTSTLDDVARRVAARLDEAGIVHAFIKGIATRSLLGTGAHQRVTTDVDLLVPRSAFSRAEGCIETLGFSRSPFRRPLHQATYYERLYVGEHHGQRILVDLHRGLGVWPVGHELAREVLTHRRRHDGLWVPANEHAVLIAALHHAKQEPSMDVRDLFDVSSFLEGRVDLDALVAAARATRCEGALLFVLRRARWMLGETTPVGDLMARLGGSLAGHHRLLIEHTLADEPAGSGTMRHRLLQDWWRHSLCSGGPTRASIELFRVASMVGLDHIWLWWVGLSP